MPWKGRRRRNGWEDGPNVIPGLGVNLGRRGKWAAAVDQASSVEYEPALAQPSSSRQYNTRFQRNRAPEQYQHGRQHPQQRPTVRRPSSEEEYDPNDRKGKGRVHFPLQTHQNFTYQHEANREIPFAKARRNSSSSESTDKTFPRYSPPPPPSPSSPSTNPDDVPPCAYCLATRKAQEQLITHFNQLTAAFVQAMAAMTGLHNWHATHSADPGDEMDWQYDVTTVWYYTDGRLGHIIEQRTIPDTTRCEGCVSAVGSPGTEAASGRVLGIDLLPTRSTGQHDGAANSEGDSSGPIVGQQTNNYGGHSAPTVEGESFAGGLYHTAGPVVDQQTQSQLLPSENTGRGYSLPTVEDEISAGGQYHTAGPVVDQQPQPHPLPSADTSEGYKAPTVEDVEDGIL